MTTVEAKKTGTSKGGAPARRAAAFMLVAAHLLLAACTTFDDLDPTTLTATQKQLEEQTSFTAVPYQQSWVNVPRTAAVVQRRLRNSHEQRIGLRNVTSVPGDNLMVLRTRIGDGSPGRMNFETFMRRIGGPPAPFQDVTSGELLTAEDSLGPYFWTERRFGSNTICVFAVRRLGSDLRQLPGRADSMDILLRNCINGTAETALAPLLDSNIGVARRTGSGQGNTRMLSPLAGPTVR